MKMYRLSTISAYNNNGVEVYGNWLLDTTAAQLEPINRTDLLAREFLSIYSSHLSSLCSPFFTPFTIHNRIFYIRNLDYMKIDIYLGCESLNDFRDGSG